MTTAVVILCTAPNGDVGAMLARGLVQANLAACVNIIDGIRSFYVWKGALQDDREVQLVIKTRRDLVDAVEKWLSKNHPYEVPEVLALTVEAGSRSYLDWVFAQTAS
jgi:periplasmic divalent cation tolerance protein